MDDQDVTPRPRKQVLCVLPLAQDKQALLQCSEEHYTFHWLDEPNLPRVFQGAVRDTKLNKCFDVVKYLERVITYVKNRQVDAVFYSSDLGGFLASVICKETGLPGPSPESQFLCIHKYYSRQVEPSKLWYEAIDLDNQQEWCAAHTKYPCLIKTPFMFRSIGVFVVKNESEMMRALSACKDQLTPWFELLSPVFRKYVDVTKYPLILKNIVICEELVEDGSIHCIEGWADKSGDLSIWLTTDNSYFSQPKKTGDAFVVPSQLPCALRQSLELAVFDCLRNYGLKNTFFNVEFWCRDNGQRVDIVEINNRICSSYFGMQCKLYGTSSYYGALHLACGEMEELKQAHTVMLRGLEQKRVAGMFLTSLHLEQDCRASAIIDFEELRRIKNGEVKDVAYTTIDLTKILPSQRYEEVVFVSLETYLLLSRLSKSCLILVMKSVIK